MSERRGRCYELAGREVTQNGGTLVHGTIVSLRFAEPIGHAWVERPDGAVWEPISEHTYPVEAFTDLLKAVAIRRYDQVAVWTESVRSGNWGPWEADTNIPDPKPWQLDPETYARLIQLNKENRT